MTEARGGGMDLQFWAMVWVAIVVVVLGVFLYYVIKSYK
jgi:hypothetical protein